MSTHSVSALAIPRESHCLALGIWRLADPKISLASFASIFLGACIAAAAVEINFSWLALTVVGIFAIEVAKNASGEIYDFDSGVDLAVKPEDKTPFSGGKRVLVDGLLTRRGTWIIAIAGYSIGAAVGFVIAALRAPVILWIGTTGMILAYQYHAPPLKLSYRGLGELAVAICYGPLIALGTYLAQTREVNAIVVLAAIPLGLLIAGFLWANEFPDYSADKIADKRTLVVKLGRPLAARFFVGIELIAFFLIGIMPSFGVTPWVELGLIGFIPATIAAVKLVRQPSTTAGLPMVQCCTLLAFLLAAIGLGAGFLIAG